MRWPLPSMKVSQRHQPVDGSGFCRHRFTAWRRLQVCRRLPGNFALAMAFALQVCPEGLLHRGGKELLPELAKWPVMYLPVCGDTDCVRYQPNRNDIVSYVKTQTY